MGVQPAEKEKGKPKYRKGLWSPEEDNKLRNHILKHGHSCWSSIPTKAGFFFFLFLIICDPSYDKMCLKNISLQIKFKKKT